MCLYCRPCYYLSTIVLYTGRIRAFYAYGLQGRYICTEKHGRFSDRVDIMWKKTAANKSIFNSFRSISHTEKDAQQSYSRANYHSNNTRTAYILHTHTRYNTTIYAKCVRAHVCVCLRAVCARVNIRQVDDIVIRHVG